MNSFRIYVMIISLLFLFINSSAFAQSNNGEQMAMLKIGDGFTKKEIKRDVSEKNSSKNYNIGLRERYELLTALRKVFVKKKTKISASKLDSTNPILKTETKIENGKKTVLITRGVANKKDNSSKLLISLREELSK